MSNHETGPQTDVPQEQVGSVPQTKTPDHLTMLKAHGLRPSGLPRRTGMDLLAQRYKEAIHEVRTTFTSNSPIENPNK